MRAMFPLMVLLATAGCVTARPPAMAGSADAMASASFRASTTIPIGGTASLGPVRIRPLAVLEDSRCPAEVQCVWAGRLRLLVEMDHRGGAETRRRELILGETIALPEGRLSFEAAAPEPVAGAPADPRSYRFTFTLIR